MLAAIFEAIPGELSPTRSFEYSLFPFASALRVGIALLRLFHTFEMLKG